MSRVLLNHMQMMNDFVFVLLVSLKVDAVYPVCKNIIEQNIEWAFQFYLFRMYCEVR